MGKDELKEVLNECFRASYLLNTLKKCRADCYLDKWYVYPISKEIDDLISDLTQIGEVRTKKVLELAED